ncbi:TAXI family TRAP transporter solute-binding subunit [Grimontia marina]|uniref:NMT1/THI5 like protein n=1 Tax=Grimontia marina TaxID=646534 RepID=A0A128FCK3_9GAMM|nr:TAXI family TRAP transporter solute-binding subunit [Grimontia marina]CZF84532.1 NMT1/THI5 like protein [Grimontia marina]
MNGLNKRFKRRGMKVLVVFCALFLTVFGTSAAETFRMSTLGPGTSPYMVMTHFANTVNREIDDYSIVVNATGAATKHALDVAKGKTDFSMTSPMMFHLMKNKKAMFKKIKNVDTLSDNLRAVFNFPMGVYHIAVYDDSGIKSLKDIKGKRVFIGPPGGVARRTSQTIIEAATGYKAGEDYTAVKLGWDSAAQAFQDKNIDVYFNPTNAPSPVISQVALTNKLRFLGISKDVAETDPKLKKLLSQPSYRLAELASDAYGPNQVNSEPVYTVGVTVGIMTNKDLSEEAIYAMTKTFWQNVEKDAENAPWLRNISLDAAFTDLNMPLHVGALKYYQEIGIR